MKKHGLESVCLYTTSTKRTLGLFTLRELFAVIKRGRRLYGQRPLTICHLQRSTTAGLQIPSKNINTNLDTRFYLVPVSREYHS